MTTLKSVQQAAADFDKAVTAAAETLKPLHTQALEQAQTVRGNLAMTVDEATRKKDLIKIIENAADNGNLSVEAAESVLNGYLTSVIASANVFEAQRRNGAFIIETLARRTENLSDTQRADLIAAIRMACKGLVRGGLVEWPASLSDAPLSVKDAELFANLIDGQAFHKHRSTHDKRARDYATACRLVDALEAAAPKLSIVGNAEESVISVMNTGRAQISAARLVFPAGEAVELSARDFARLTEDKFGRHYLTNNTLTVTHKTTNVESVA